MHTSQLHSTPRMSAVLNAIEVLAAAMAAGAADAESVPPATTSAARATDPTKLPAYE